MTAPATRPRTIHEISRRASAGEQAFDPALREFLDTFYSYPDERDAASRARHHFAAGCSSSATTPWTAHAEPSQNLHPAKPVT